MKIVKLKRRGDKIIRAGHCWIYSNEIELKLLSPNGVLLSCSCSMLVSYDALKLELMSAAASTQIALQIVERGFQDIDHPVHLFIHEMEYLKAIFCYRGLHPKT